MERSRSISVVAPLPMTCGRVDLSPSKARAQVDLWLKELAPSPSLRTWYGHDLAKYVEFRQRYEAELAAEPAQAALARRRELAQHQQVTLVVAARDLEHSTAPVVRDLLTRTDG